jgi:hypothetical protein
MGLSGIGQLSGPEGLHRKVQLPIGIHGFLGSAPGWDGS